MKREKEEKEFVIEAADQTRHVCGRKSAVKLAKSLSQKYRYAELKRVDGKVSMQFRGGEIETYACHARRR